ncbi:MAG: hypothetical protein II282_07495, partial [Alistipes sp.]|nr:hypothetical protein [Alistipes sp.]
MKKILALLLAASFLAAPFNLYADDNEGETPPPPPPPQPPTFIPKPNPDGGEINPCSLSPISGQCANGEIEIIFGADFGTVSITAVNIDNFTNDILNGKTNLTQFNQAEHAGLCCAGEMLIGAYLVS